MPFYKMLCIAAHYPEFKHIKDLVTQSSKLLLENGSAVRKLEFMGTRVLPQRMRRHKHYHSIGDYWMMHFDTSPKLLSQLSERMRTDPRVIRWTMLKIGERLEDVVVDDVRSVNLPPESSVPLVFAGKKTGNKKPRSPQYRY